MSPKRQREMLLKRDGRACFYCTDLMQDKDITIEHLIPLSKGGSDVSYNIVLACKICNNAAEDLPVYVKVNRAVKLRVEKLILNKPK